MTAKYLTATDMLGSWFTEIESGEPPVRFAVPPPFETLDIRPGRLVMFGGAPGGGKTAAILQAGIDILRACPDTRLMIANVEMVPPMLLNRIVSRLSSVPLSNISERTLSPDQLARVRSAVSAMAPIADRLAFLSGPYSIESVADAASRFQPNIIAIDYIQRFSVGDGTKEPRQQLERAATILRCFCDAGAAVLVASAVARQKSQKGSTYSGLNLASFRGSSELEYGCDSAYLFAPSEGDIVTLQCEKNRYAEPADIVTRFDRNIQKFTPAPAGLAAFGLARKEVE